MQLTHKDLSERITYLEDLVIERFKQDKILDPETKIISSECMALKEAIVGNSLRKILEHLVKTEQYLTAEGVKNAMEWIKERNYDEAVLF